MSKSDAFVGKPVRIPKALRDDLEAAIEAHLTAAEKLTAVLDKADGNPDDEASIGSPYRTPAALADCEGEHDGREPDDDAENTWTETHGRGGRSSIGDELEPSLAHTNDIDQERARKHLRGINTSEDLEDEHDGREPQCEDEGAQCEDEGAGDGETYV